MEFKTRVQIVVGDTLIAEAVVPNMAEADKFWSHWCRERASESKPMGCAAFTREDICQWPVAVGEKVDGLK